MRLVPAILAVLLAGSISAFADDDTACPLPGKPPIPRMRTHTLAPYPPASARLNERGSTLMSVTIGRDGTPGDIRILQSSGSETLDDASAAFLKSQWRWKPFPADCAAASVPQRVMFIWGAATRPPKADILVAIAASQFPEGAAERYESGDTYLALTLEDGGKVTDGAVMYSSGYADLDEKALALMKTSPGVLAAEPAGKKIVVAQWRAPGVDYATEVVVMRH